MKCPNCEDGELEFVINFESVKLFRLIYRITPEGNIDYSHDRFNYDADAGDNTVECNSCGYCPDEEELKKYPELYYEVTGEELDEEN